MLNLATRSIVVLSLLFALLFAIGTAAMYALHAPMWFAVLFACGFMGVQFLISPWIIQLVLKINWVPVDSVDPSIASLIRDICHKRGIREPRFGLIEDGNPNAFTFGHYPGDARVVISRGILDLCDERERRAVIAHEMGHIVHWDFVVMTVAATIPLILYYVYRFGFASGRGSRRGGGMAAVGLAAFIAYIISQYIVLFLSRVREYYADHFSAESTRDPNALATALVKIAYGLAGAPKPVADKKLAAEMGAPATANAGITAGGIKTMGIFDARFGASMALAAAGSFNAATHTYDTETTVKAMRWDIFNPWAFICELSSTHPLPAKRIKALDRFAPLVEQQPVYNIPSKADESYMDEFATDLFMNYLPALGVLVGLGLAFGLGMHKVSAGSVGAVVLCVGIASLLRTRYMYPMAQFADKQVHDLLPEIKVSRIRCIPAILRGKIIGRGIPGLYWSQDLVVQDETGFMVLQYHQPLRVLQFLFGLFKAGEFVGEDVVAEGWYRRFPMPYLELWQVRRPNGEVHTSHNRGFAYYGSWALAALGLAALLIGLMGQV
jgi:heat shock protein HtpX